MLPADAVLDGEVVVLGAGRAPRRSRRSRSARRLGRREDVARAAVETARDPLRLRPPRPRRPRPAPAAARGPQAAARGRGPAARPGALRRPRRWRAGRTSGARWRRAGSRGSSRSAPTRRTAPASAPRPGRRSGWRGPATSRWSASRARGRGARPSARCCSPWPGRAASASPAASAPASPTARWTSSTPASRPARGATPPCAGPVPKGRENVWVEPEVVVEVRFAEWTEEGLLRQPVFVRVRDDRRPAEAVREGLLPHEAPPPGAPRRSPGAARGRGDERGEGLVPRRRDHEGRRRRATTGRSRRSCCRSSRTGRSS